MEYKGYLLKEKPPTKGGHHKVTLQILKAHATYNELVLERHFADANGQARRKAYERAKKFVDDLVAEE